MKNLILTIAAILIMSTGFAQKTNPNISFPQHTSTEISGTIACLHSSNVNITGVEVRVLLYVNGYIFGEKVVHLNSNGMASVTFAEQGVFWHSNRSFKVVTITSHDVMITTGTLNHAHCIPTVDGYTFGTATAAY
ncbi:MAG: hypothetical protein N4A72_08205 [Bacteroidales bacterium]|jgi:hypothetical protein|nr:hypothetical protein [Bacteroidales bacterium]